MIRYKTLKGAESSNSSTFRNKLRQSLPRFLAYCGIMRACRSIPQFRQLKPVVVGLLLPAGADKDIYEEAVHYAAHGPSFIYGGLDGTEILTKGDRWTKAKEAELSTALSKRRRVVLVMESGAEMPDYFRLAADGVVEVGPILPRHVIAGARLCLKTEITPEQADFIATMPLSVIGATLRPGRSVAHAIKLMVQASAPRAAKDISGPTLDDLHGLGEAGEWGRELATDLADWRAGRIGWADVDRGILLSGPPGTGKTTFAGALARTCNVHLVLGSLGRWQAKGHLGDLLKAMRAAFDDARRNAPSIIFIDEIDAVGDREKFSDHNAQYCTEVVAALLECIDGAEGREGVVVVGACNHPHRLDAAIVRAGRLDRHVRIPLPDQKGREGILRWHLQGMLVDADLSEVAGRTEGWNGASLEQLVRQARRRARRARRDMTLNDLASELPALVPIPPEMRRRTAVHETGHAIVALALACGELVSVSVEKAILPNPELFQNGGGTLFRDKGIKERTQAQLLDSIAVRLGGIAAEEVVFGERSAGGGGGRGSDLHTATLSALAFEASYGLGEGLAYLAPDDEEELFSALRLDRFLHARVDKMLLEQFQRAKRVIERERLEVNRVAEALLVKGTLDASEVVDLVAQQPRLKLVDGDDRKTG
ncbi:AAA family ATPase [Mesorhizobium sp.]|uniref:AAA family ATPase n=5 Tax=unclassified Mesorhizobium TaxID=325217 RepID=UPI00120AF95E|nr:AAA family ATPase [Mesorhizobium sp.]TIM76597.1 MAG: AAA family ATPase [Mesorhizobium sp.]TIN56174.1 MAG: AAA family ATPase [Mesorhizobium sp.]TIS29447.1 MAG: AAA family ATPase [Mesorhizobium sp.]